MSYLSSTVGVLWTLVSSFAFSLVLALPNWIPSGMTGWGGWSLIFQIFQIFFTLLTDVSTTLTGARARNLSVCCARERALSSTLSSINLSLLNDNVVLVLESWHYCSGQTSRLLYLNNSDVDYSGAVVLWWCGDAAGNMYLWQHSSGLIRSETILTTIKKNWITSLCWWYE